MENYLWPTQSTLIWPQPLPMARPGIRQNGANLKHAEWVNDDFLVDEDQTVNVGGILYENYYKNQQQQQQQQQNTSTIITGDKEGKSLNELWP